MKPGSCLSPSPRPVAPVLGLAIGAGTTYPGTMVRLRFLLVSAGLAALGCAELQQPPSNTPSAPKAPAAAQSADPHERPSPQSMSVRNPGGDATDPERAALQRLLDEPWGNKPDRWGTMDIPLAAKRHWSGVKLTGYPTRAAYRFGYDRYAFMAVWYHQATGSDEPGPCLDRFLADMKGKGEVLGLSVTSSQRVDAQQVVQGDLKPVVVELIDADVDSVVESEGYKGALASYRSWPGTCLIQGFAVRGRKHPELAKRVRDRWVAEAATKVLWKAKVTSAPPPKAR